MTHHSWWYKSPLRSIFIIQIRKHMKHQFFYLQVSEFMCSEIQWTERKSNWLVRLFISMWKHKGLANRNYIYIYIYSNDNLPCEEPSWQSARILISSTSLSPKSLNPPFSMLRCQLDAGHPQKESSFQRKIELAVLLQLTCGNVSGR